MNNNDATAQPSASGTICGVRVEEVTEPTMREIRNLDKLIDELAKGQAHGEDPAAGVAGATTPSLSKRPRSPSRA